MSDHPIVFFSKMAQAVPSIGPVVRLCGGVFVSNRRETLEFFSRNYPEVPTLKYPPILKSLSRAHRALSDAKVIVSGAGHQTTLGRYGAPRAMVFHGTFRALRRENLKEMVGFTHVFLLGPRMERMLLRHSGSFDFQHCVTGYIPFSEFPAPTPENRMRFLAKLGLDPERPTVFYAPARRDCGSWAECAEAMARQVPAAFNLVMRPHPNQALHGSRAERRLYQHIAAILRDRGHAVIDLAICSFPELMCATDVLIGDATSPNEEFMLYDRPQIITETYPRETWHERYVAGGMHPDDVGELMGLYDCAFSYARGGFRDWAQAVEHAHRNPLEHQQKRRTYFESAFGPDASGAAQRTAEELKKLAS